MQIKETIGVSFPGSVESPSLEDVVVLVDSADDCSSGRAGSDMGVQASALNSNVSNMRKMNGAETM